MWKRVLKIILFAIIGLLIVILITALFVPKTFHFERSAVIASPADSVWKYTGSFAGLDKWSPWNDYDPDVKKKLMGVDGTIGASQSWDSKIIGSGSQTILRVEKSALLEMKLDFLKPQESHGTAHISLEVLPAGKTKVIWGMTGRLKYPYNVMILFMNMEKMMGNDFDHGLNKLKTLVEK